MARRRKAGGWWSTSVRGGGWVAVSYVPTTTGDVSAQRPLLVRVKPDMAGRLQVMELYMGGDTPLSAEALHTVRLGSIEELLNLPGTRDGIIESLTEEPFVDTAAARRWLNLQMSARKVAMDMAAVDKHFGSRPRLQKPEGRPYGDEFYKAVAAAYRHAQLRGVAPGPAIAEEAGVPVTSVARWIKEARARNYLHVGQRAARGAQQ